MRRTFFTLVVTLLTATFVAQPASAAEVPFWTYTGTAGGTQITVLGTVVNSDQTAQSAIAGSRYPNSASNTLASASVDGVLSVGAVTTKVQASTATDGTNKIRSTARTAGINLLNGLITADAVTTVSEATQNGNDLTAKSFTTLANLKIGNTTYPLTVTRNLTVNVPGIAKIVVNESRTTDTGNSLITRGTGLHITLLQGFGSVPAGADIQLNPTTAGFRLIVPKDATPVGGYAFGTKVIADALPAHVLSNETARVTLPGGGTNGRTFSNRTLSINVLSILGLGAVECTSRGTSVPLTADVFHTASIGRVSLLKGIVRADAIKTHAGAKKLADGTMLEEGATQFVNLKIAGVTLPVNIGPNTRIKIPDVGIVIINEVVVPTDGRIRATGLRIRLGYDLLGLPAGTEIRVAEASSWVG